MEYEGNFFCDVTCDVTYDARWNMRGNFFVIFISKHKRFTFGLPSKSGHLLTLFPKEKSLSKFRALKKTKGPRISLIDIEL